MIRFYFNLAPNPVKVALMLEELGLRYEAVPVDTAKGEQHGPAFRAINPNGKVPAIVDTEGPGGREARVFDSNAILLYLGEKSGRFIGAPPIGPSSCRGSFSSPRGWAPSRVRRCISSTRRRRRFPMRSTGIGARSSATIGVLDRHLAGRDFIVGADYSIVDMAAWGWLTRAGRVLPGADDPLAAFPNLKRLFERVDARPAAARAKEIGKDHPFKKEVDEETKRAMFPSNYPEIAM